MRVINPPQKIRSSRVMDASLVCILLLCRLQYTMPADGRPVYPFVKSNRSLRFSAISMYHVFSPIYFVRGLVWEGHILRDT